MTTRIAFLPDARVTLPDGLFRFSRAVRDGYLFTSEDNGDTVLFAWNLVEDWYAQGQVRIHGRKSTNRYDDSAMLGPGETLDKHAAARAWFTRKWDADQCALSTNALEAFIAHYSTRALVDGVQHIPSPGALRRAIHARGEMGRRPDRVMRSRTGQVPRPPKVSPFVKDALLSCVAWYWSERGRDKQDTHARLVRMVRLRNKLKIFSKRPDFFEVSAPTKETTRNWINESECYLNYAFKYGVREAKLRFQGSRPTLQADHVLDMIAIDATVVDNWCVWRGETLTPLGRPTLYQAIDVRSRMVVAWHLSYEPPSLYGAMSLIKRVITPQADGIWGRPGAIVLDNAWENVSPSFQTACASAGIALHFAPIRTPEYKGIVERMFRTINKMVFHKLLGGSVPFSVTMMRKLGLNPMKDANITIEDLEDQLRYALRELYPKRKHTGIGEVPQVVWDKELQAHNRNVVDDLPALLLHFGQVEYLTLTRTGVVTKDGLRFSGVMAVTQLLDDLAKNTPIDERREGSATTKVKVVIDPEDISKAQVWNPRTRRMVTLESAHPQFAHACASRWVSIGVEI